MSAAQISNANIGKEFARPETVSEIFDIPINSLQAWRSQGDGPPFYRRGRAVYYKIAEVREWLTADRRTPLHAA